MAAKTIRYPSFAMRRLFCTFTFSNLFASWGSPSTKLLIFHFHLQWDISSFYFYVTCSKAWLQNGESDVWGSKNGSWLILNYKEKKLASFSVQFYYVMFSTCEVFLTFLFTKISVPFAPLLAFQNFWSNGKCPKSHCIVRWPPRPGFSSTCQTEFEWLKLHLECFLDWIALDRAKLRTRRSSVRVTHRSRRGKRFSLLSCYCVYPKRRSPGLIPSTFVLNCLIFSSHFAGH